MSRESTQAAVAAGIPAGLGVRSGSRAVTVVGAFCGVTINISVSISRLRCTGRAAFMPISADFPQSVAPVGSAAFRAEGLGTMRSYSRIVQLACRASHERPYLRSRLRIRRHPVEVDRGFTGSMVSPTSSEPAVEQKYSGAASFTRQNSPFLPSYGVTVGVFDNGLALIPSARL